MQESVLHFPAQAAGALPDAVFAQGPVNPWSKFFTGRTWLTMLSEGGDDFHAPIGNVTFEPGARTHWHRHSGGQILLVLAGRGLFQIRGQKAQAIRRGDVVRIPIGVDHWHGAAPDSWMTHVSLETNAQSNRAEWLEPVDDVRYAQAAGDAAPIPVSGTLDAVEERLRRENAGTVRELPPLEASLAEIACLASLGTLTVLEKSMRRAFSQGVPAAALREAAVQTMPYAGMARAQEALAVLERVLPAGEDLPDAQTVTDATRFAEGLGAQKALFGEAIGRMHESARPEERALVVGRLTGWCFGDTYTRGVLTLAQRELLTFVSIASIGGADPQVRAHAAGCRAAGISEAVLLDVLFVLAPWIGFPRTLNALAQVRAALQA